MFYAHLMCGITLIYETKIFIALLIALQRIYILQIPFVAEIVTTCVNASPTTYFQW
jgi:hypothetical protein